MVIRHHKYNPDGSITTTVIEPTEKSPAIERIFASFFVVDRREAILSGLCVDCKSEGNGVESFRDELSRREYAISGLCQRCQDEVFEVDLFGGYDEYLDEHEAEEGEPK